MTQHAAFIYLCEHQVRSRIAIKGANTILLKLKAMVGGLWTPASVLAHEGAEYMGSGQSTRKVDAIMALAALFNGPAAPDLFSMTDRQILASQGQGHRRRRAP